MIPRPGLFGTYPDLEFATYFTTPRNYPNSDLGGAIYTTADGVFETTFLHQGVWWGDTLDGNGDYIVFQGTVLNPIPEIYGTIEFMYVTRLGWYEEWTTFVIPEPATAVLLALGAGVLLRRRGAC